MAEWCTPTCTAQVSAGIVLAHGARFDKASWKTEATELAEAGISRGGDRFPWLRQVARRSKRKPGMDDMYMDVLGGGALSAGEWRHERRGDRRQHGRRGVRERGGPRQSQARSTGWFCLLRRRSRNRNGSPARSSSSRARTIRSLRKCASSTRRSRSRNELQVLDGSAHAQFLFTTPHREHIMGEILSFLGGRSTAAH